MLFLVWPDCISPPGQAATSKSNEEAGMRDRAGGKKRWAASGLCVGVVGLALWASGTPEATASYSTMTPNDVMAKMGQTISFITKQKPAHAQIRPKRAHMTGRTFLFWGGKDTCRPGHDVDPNLWLLKQTPNLGIAGDCNPNFTVRHGTPEKVPSGEFTDNMNKVAGALMTRDGLRLPHGNTTRIQATNTTAKFKFRCNGQPGDTARSLTINAKGRVVDITNCTRPPSSSSARYASSAHATRRTPSLSWTLPQAANEGASVPFAWTGHHLGQHHRLVVQRPVGTAHTWRTILRLKGNSGSAALPGMPLGKYRLRLADLSGYRVLAQQVAGIAVFGQVPLSTLLRGHTNTGVDSLPSTSFPYVYTFGKEERSALWLEHSPCQSIHIAFAPESNNASGTGTVTLVQETRDPVSASAPNETLGSLDADLVVGQSWAINTKWTIREEIEEGLQAEFATFYINGYAICDTTEPLFS